jgi:hypothetical protein
MQHSHSSSPNTPSKEEFDFHKHLSVLASMCKFDLTLDMIGVFDRVFGGMGYEMGTAAIVRVLCSRNAKDPFPSLSDLIILAKWSEEDPMSAQEAADRVWKSIGEFGAYQRELAREKLNRLCNEVIDRTDWAFLCAAETSQGPTIRAQLRGTAQSIIDSRKQSEIDSLLKTVPKLSQMKALHEK